MDPGWQRCVCAVAAFAVSVLVFATAAQANVESQALYARGLISFNGGDWAAAHQQFNSAVDADPNDALARYYRGLAQARLGNTAEAVSDIEQALVLDPELPHASLDLGIAYVSAGRFADAKTVLERAYQRGSEKLTAAFFLGIAMYRLDEKPGALRYFNEAKADPELSGAASYYAGLIELDVGQEAPARSDFETTARLLPQAEIGRAAQEYLVTGHAPQAQTAPETKPWSAYGRLNFEYDSNVTIGPGSSNYATPVDITGKSDGSVVVAAGGRYKFLDSARFSVAGTYDFSQSIHFDLTQFDLQGHRLGIALASQSGPFSYGIAGGYNFFALNYQSFYQEGLGTPWLTYAENDWAATQAYYTLRGQDFFRGPYDPGRDGINNAFGLRQFFTLGDPERILGFGYQFDLQSSSSNGTQGKSFDYEGQQFDIGIGLPVFDETRLLLAYLFRYDGYDNLQSGFGSSRRHDNENQFFVDIVRPISDYVSVSLSYIGVINDSNIVQCDVNGNCVRPFEYDRNIVSLGVNVVY